MRVESGPRTLAASAADAIAVACRAASASRNAVAGRTAARARHPGSMGLSADELEQHRGAAALTFVAVAVWPRLARVTQAPAMFSPRGIAAYVVGWATVLFALRQWGFPALRRHGERYALARAELRAELGREPLAGELAERMRARVA